MISHGTRRWILQSFLSSTPPRPKPTERPPKIDPPTTYSPSGPRGIFSGIYRRAENSLVQSSSRRESRMLFASDLGTVGTNTRGYSTDHTQTQQRAYTGSYPRCLPLITRLQVCLTNQRQHTDSPCVLGAKYRPIQVQVKSTIPKIIIIETSI
ncbi:hypothetical protein BDW74DRAFT_157174 [Aspergillus multicolor]|uniref:uncharacterized protein n=1 Tax=Aspergillus multicolor TaxID=41759 RepID=UPI003CCD7844